MKNSRILIFICYSLFWQLSFAHSVVETEKLLEEKSVVSFILQKGNELNWDQKILQVFVFKNFVELEDDVLKTANLAFHEHMELNELAVVLDEINSKYNGMLEAFDSEMKADPNLIESSIAEMNSIAQASAASNCTNVGFESGAFTNWEVRLGYRWYCDYSRETTNLNCFNFNPSSYAIANAANTSNPQFGNRLEIIDKNTVPNLYDDFVGGEALPMVSPDGGNYSIRLENKTNGYGATEISYEFVVDPNNPFFEYQFAAVMEDPGESHPAESKPFFSVKIYEDNGDEIECARYIVIADSEDKYFETNIYKEVPGKGGFKYCDWQKIAIPLSEFANETLTIKFIASDCPWGGHMGYAYVDGSCFNASITQSDCNLDGTRDLEFPEGFDSYLWLGHELVTTNSSRSIKVRGEGPFKLMAHSRGCMHIDTISLSTCDQPPAPSCALSLSNVNVTACDIENEHNVTGTVSISLSNYSGQHHVLVTNGIQEQVFEYVENTSLNFSFENLYSDGEQREIKAYLFTDEFFAKDAAICTQTTTYNAPESCITFPQSCACIGSFAPIQKDKVVHGITESGIYVLGAWIKEHNAPATQISYDDAYIRVEFYNGATQLTSTSFNASGMIIDGWQRIHEEFEVPPTATSIQVILGTTSGEAYFDDIRIYPKDGSMQSYVYDPVSLKLVASLDENNYATLYEYDNEGRLIRTKKETERGIITIQENRQSTIKQ